MSDNPSSPLLGARNSPERSPSRQSIASSSSNRSSKAVNTTESSTSERTAQAVNTIESYSSQRSSRAVRRTESSSSKRSDQALHTTESSPLLPRDGDYEGYGDAPNHDGTSSPAQSWLRHVQKRFSSKGKSRRWPTVLALTVLVAAVLVILGLGFAAPAVVEEYAREAMVFKPTDLSIDSFTSTGVVARVQGDFKLDGSRVRRKPVRDLGRACTWIAKAVESKNSHVEVFLPEYGDILLGTAEIPPIKVSVRDGVTTHIDFLSDLSAGDVDGIKAIAQDWIRGSVKSLSVRGVAEVPLKSGIFSFGTKQLTESIVFEGNAIPVLPPYNIGRLNFYEKNFTSGETGMAADVIVNIGNQYPVTLTVPPLGFQVLVDDCSPDLPHIPLADAALEKVDIRPKQDIEARVIGVIRSLPESVIKACPQTEKSPLDALVGDYIRGEDSTVYIQGADPPTPETPDWVVDFMKGVTLPISFPGKSFDNLIRNFSLEDVHFGLPDPFASPKSPQALPRISAVIKALVGLPDEMNFRLNVPHVRAQGEVYFKGKKLGQLDLHKWQKSKSTRIDAHGDVKAGMAVEAKVKDAPLEITDEDVFSDLVQALLFGNRRVILGVKAEVDVETETALGKFVVRGIPAEGKIFVKPISKQPSGDLTSFSPKINDIQIVQNTTKTLTLLSSINLTNPTPYSATIPYIDINLLSNGTVLGHITVRNTTIHPGNNTFVPLTAVWDPQEGAKGDSQGRELLSQFISGFNTSLTFRTHEGTLPTVPVLGRALSNFSVSIPTPRFSNPGDGKSVHFIKHATFHIFSSKASFVLVSPLHHNTIHLSYLNATAYYNHTEPVGQILQLPDPNRPPGEGDGGFDIPPGEKETPKLPVEWDITSVGYQVIKAALGGHLKLDASAVLEVTLGQWRSGRLWFLGRGLGAGVSFL